MRDGGYRTREEVEAWRQRDPIKRLRAHLVDHAATLDAIDREIEQLATDALEWAKASAYPDASTVLEHVYA
jgi:TPP-dependent pyruvate/acetoin dehydrogenase alpha subunit